MKRESPRLPWTKFFWADWESDAALRMCGLAAQGLWMRMLCIAAQHDPIGYVAINGRPLGVTDIARMAGVTETEAAELLEDLSRNGVFSRDRRGTIYSRRLIRDAKRTAIARKNGKTGGNPTLLKERENSDQDNPPLKSADNTQRPEARSQIKKREANASPKERGSRLSEAWVPGPLSAQAARDAAKLGAARVERELGRFRNYWLGKPGREAIKLDWDRTWWNWLGKAADDEGRQRRPVTAFVAPVGF